MPSEYSLALIGTLFTVLGAIANILVLVLMLARKRRKPIVGIFNRLHWPWIASSLALLLIAVGYFAHRLITLSHTVAISGQIVVPHAYISGSAVATPPQSHLLGQIEALLAGITIIIAITVFAWIRRRRINRELVQSPNAARAERA